MEESVNKCLKKKASESSTISATEWTPVISLGAEAKKCLLKSSGKNVILKKNGFKYG